MKWLQKWLGKSDKKEEAVAVDAPVAEVAAVAEPVAAVEALAAEVAAVPAVEDVAAAVVEPVAAVEAPAVERVAITADLADEIAKSAESPELAIELMKEQATEQEATAKGFVALRKKYDEVAAANADMAQRLQALAKAGEETPVSATSSESVAAGKTAIQAYADHCRATAKKGIVEKK